MDPYIIGRRGDGDESPVGDHASDSEGTVWVGSGDEILNCGGIEELDVGE